MKMTLQELEEQLRQLKEMEEKTPDIFKKLDEEYWIVRSLKDLYEMAKDYDQTEIPEFKDCDFVPAKRVIKSHAYINNVHIKRYKIDCVMFCGLFLAADGYFVSKKLMDELFSRLVENKSCPSEEDIVKYNLPRNLRYETIRFVESTGNGFLLKDTDANEPFRSWNYWEFLDI